MRALAVQCHPLQASACDHVRSVYHSVATAFGPGTEYVAVR
jgi:hypothetical protein